MAGPALNPSPMLIEGGLAAIAVALAFCWPTLGVTLFAPAERALGWLARRRTLAVAIVFATCLLSRLALLPLIPIPQPFVPDDFSFLLAANTFAAGRLANPTPALWIPFESIHISMHPTYMSMYFPAQGMLLAAGKLLTGNAWFGLLFVTALMCAAVCWMLQAWLPPRWALLGGLLAVVHLGLFSYWIDTYSGAGSIAALGGALVLGAFPRILRRPRLRHTLLLAGGMVIVALSRPFEGCLLCLPVAFVLARWLIRGKNRPLPVELVRLAALPLAIVAAGTLWLGYYDARVNGNPLTLPYTINRATYAVAPYWIWQAPRPAPVYHNAVMRDFYVHMELPYVHRIQTPLGFLNQLLFKPIIVVLFFAGIALLPPLLWLPRALRDRRMRFFVLAAIVWIPGMLIQIFLLPHYVAVFTGAFYCIGLQAMRHMRLYRMGLLPVGIGLARFLVVALLAVAGLRAAAEPLHLALARWPGVFWNFEWYGPGNFGAQRAAVEANLEKLAGRQLVLVRYSPTHCSEDEWVYNGPDLENARVLWARELDTASNQALMQHYSGRQIWLVQPDRTPVSVSAYTPQTASPESFVNTRTCPTIPDQHL